jgi:hypothetical protein
MHDRITALIETPLVDPVGAEVGRIRESRQTVGTEVVEPRAQHPIAVCQRRLALCRRLTGVGRGIVDLHVHTRGGLAGLSGSDRDPNGASVARGSPPPCDRRGAGAICAVLPCEPAVQRTDPEERSSLHKHVAVVSRRCVDLVTATRTATQYSLTPTSRAGLLWLLRADPFSRCHPDARRRRRSRERCLVDDRRGPPRPPKVEAQLRA